MAVIVVSRCYLYYRHFEVRQGGNYPIDGSVQGD